MTCMTLIDSVAILTKHFFMESSKSCIQGSFTDRKPLFYLDDMKLTSTTTTRLRARLVGTSVVVMREGQALLFHFPHPDLPCQSGV